jgi:multidrug efflux pump subunit AcrA (membrane-fusion protein)
MSMRHRSGIAALMVAAGLGLAGCGGAARGANPAPPEVATVEAVDGGGPAVVTLTEVAERRLVIRTAPARPAAAGGVVVPYSAVVYEPDGSSWVYVQPEAHRYQRTAIAIAGISGDQVTLTSGPRPGAQVVTQGVAELVGVETGIDGEE